MKKSVIFALMATVCASTAVAADYPVSQPIQSIPTPPVGQRWVLNETFSDEFNGSELDSNKWYDHHPTWAGRQPGFFMKENVAVEDGHLVLTSSKPDEPIQYQSKWGDKKIIEYTVGGAAVVSKSEEAHYGYYESRVKANKTSMSTTFWLSRGGNHPVEGNQPDWISDGMFGQELDICETIGRSGTPAEGWKPMAAAFSKGMNSNVHCWHAPTGGKRTDVAIKKIPAMKPQNGKLLSEDFNIYGCWWKNENTAEFYMNNESGGEKKFLDRQGRPFNLPKPMGLNLVVETYGWIPTPTDADLNDPEKNRTYYDWVRHYVLVAAHKSGSSKPAEGIFANRISLGEKPAKLAAPAGKKGGVELNIQYTTSANREIEVEIFDANNKSVASTLLPAYIGYANQMVKLPAKYTKGAKYTAVVYLRDAKSKNNNKAIEGDSFSFVVE